MHSQQAWRPHGYGAALQDLYQRKLDLVQRGYSGYNTDWALLLARQIFPFKSESVDVKVLSILFGANDAVEEGGQQHVPLDRYKRNLKSIVELLHNANSNHYSPGTEILIIGVPPVCVGIPTRTRERTQSYARASLEVVNELRAAGNNNVWHVEVHDAMLARASEIAPKEPENALWQLLEDGLHLTAEGYKVVTAQIMKVINAQLPQLSPDNLLRFCPDWGSIDPADPQKLLGDLKRHGFSEGIAFNKG